MLWAAHPNTFAGSHRRCDCPVKSTLTFPTWTVCRASIVSNRLQRLSGCHSDGGETYLPQGAYDVQGPMQPRYNVQNAACSLQSVLHAHDN